MGGLDGAKPDNFRRLATGRLEELPKCATITLQPDETVLSHTSGGGGYGPPHERPPKKVAHDLAEGWISRERAAEAYGVLADDDGAVDEAATAKRRKALAGPG